MLIIIKTAKTVRNHWKKSVFFTGIITYGVIYTKNYIQTQDLMRAYCQKAAKYGKEHISPNENLRHVTIILNPNANKRKSTEEFEKYCAPLLHLAGINVDIRKTESEGHAKNLIEEIGGTDAIVIAGGDGTLSEVVTGLLRKNNDSGSKIPLGILPLGKTNSLASVQFPGKKKVERVKALADATMAVIEETIRPVDVMKIEVLSLNEETGKTNKPIYAVGSLKWGAYRDAEAIKESYWYFGPLKNYATYIFNGFKNKLTWRCVAQLSYSAPCEGCSHCYRRLETNTNGGGFFSKFMKTDNPHAKYLSVSNPECQINYEKKILTSDLALSTMNITPNQSSDSLRKLIVEIGPDNVEYLDFVKNGIKLEKGEKRDIKEIIEAKIIKISPEDELQNAWFSIDNEHYEVKPVQITLLPRIINMFCKQENINI
ncbi:acylglycerol kinase, mitochondrial [Diorhabda carinulata]|uniref:acylglycerol kinase, mitochondrial n=1 Tax=Diorhabda carinulata TaxID=1163345 RepID=UPI0025A19C6E|nr:acylglycerol kinase, mitochondrial [Diorhabda carinulata]